MSDRFIRPSATHRPPDPPSEPASSSSTRSRLALHGRSKSQDTPSASNSRSVSPLYRFPGSHSSSQRAPEGSDSTAIDASGDLGTRSGGASRRRGASMMSHSHAAAELTTGQCMCCNSSVRWPSNLTQFRCTICMTVNDLNPAKQSLGDSENPSPPQRLPLSIDTVKEIIDTATNEFLADRSFRSQSASTDSNLLDFFVPPIYTTEDTSRFESDDFTIPPSRPPPPPPPPNSPMKCVFVKTKDSQNSGGELLAPDKAENASIRRILRPLEDYIMKSFSSWECLNTSFMDESSEIRSQPSIVPNLTPNEIAPHSRKMSETFIPVTDNPGEKEALMLTVGRAVVRRERVDSRIDKGSKEKEAKQSVRIPIGIDWDWARNFYDVLLNAGNSIVSALEYRDNQTRTWKVELAVKEATVDMLLLLLKTTESLLRRPGRPLRRPDDIRFLLVILANPILYPGASRLLSSGTSKLTRSSTFSSGSTDRPHSPSGKDRPMNVPGYQSGLLKRVFGLLSNLPNECHHFLVAWFSIMPEPHFRQLVELGGSFTTYRITRQDQRKSTRGFGRLSYSDDWQIKAVARVMSLLEKANSNTVVRRRYMRSTSAGEQWKQKSADHQGLILPINAFYNMRLDYCDLIADFEVWESKVAKFCFCQYPFYLSMGSKIQILEHDARRQMEIQARNAFINNISNRTTVSQYMVLKVRRDCLVEDSLKGISESVGTMEDIKKGLRVEFAGEDGIDAGGLKKEWFLMVAREVFDPNHGLFIYDEDSQYCYFNPNSFESSEEFYLVGVLLGLAIYNSTILDVSLPPYVFRKLIYFAPQYGKNGIDNRPRPPFRRSLEDLALIRPALTRGLQKLLDFEGNVGETFCRDFVAEIDRYGEKMTVPLCTNGENRPVTNSNRKEFVDLYVKHILDTSVTRQFEPFKRGFYTVCAGNALSLFGPEEIELLVCGSVEPLDVQALKAVAIYDGWGQNNAAELDIVVKWFWAFFEKITPEEQRMLLSFITGSDRIPAMGATSLTIKVVCLGEDCNRFPVARTCFNQICLWRYRRREKLEQMLRRAVTESEGFGLK